LITIKDIKMSLENVLVTLLGLGALFFAVSQLNQPVKEGFAGTLPPMKFIRQQVASSGPQKGDFFAIPGNYQSSLSPTGGAGMVDYGANIRYKLPKNEHLRTPDYANMVQENQKCSTQEGYCSGCSGCKEGYCQKSSKQSSGVSNLPNSYPEVTDMLPVQSMANQTVNALGEISQQPIVYDRFIYANQKSFSRGQGDPIRGDLPIVPIKTGWFRPSKHPQIDLRDGALAVVAGPGNETAQQLMALQNASSGGLLDVGSGINYTVQKDSLASAAGGDITVTAFP
jgi:hypothetical protein